MAEQKKVGFWLGMGIVFVPIIFAWFTLRKGHSVLSRVLAMGWLFLSFLVIAAPTPPKPDEAPKAEPQAVAVVVSEPKQEATSEPIPTPEPEKKEELKRLNVSEKDVTKEVDKINKIAKSPEFAYTIKKNIVMQESGFNASMLHFKNNFFIQMIGDKKNTNNLTEISFMFHYTKYELTNISTIGTATYLTKLVTKTDDKATKLTLEMLKKNMDAINNGKKGRIEDTRNLNGFKMRLTTDTELGGITFFTITKE